MASIGSILRSRAPKFYYALNALKIYLYKLNEPYTIYITDSLGGSFKAYFEKHDMHKTKELLIKGLDQDSIRVVDTVYHRLNKYPDESKKVKINKNQPIYGGRLPVEEPEMVNKIKLKLKGIDLKYDLSNNCIDASTFYFFHGLILLPASILNYIKREDFVDIGAYVGDSAIALNKYDYKKIYSIEISKHSIKNYHLNMKKVGISYEKYEVINVAVSDSDDLPVMELPDTGSAGFSLLRKHGKYDYIKIEQKSFDKIVNEYGIQPRFIKVDIEGYAMHFVKGALLTLKKYRPVLSIAIYHNPTEFFEIKPLLESELIDYQFMIRKLTPGIQKNLCHSEVILLAYPKEITLNS